MVKLLIIRKLIIKCMETASNQVWGDAVRCVQVCCDASDAKLVGAMGCGVVRCVALRCDVLRCDALRFDAVRSGAVRCNAVRCDATRCGATRVVEAIV